MAISAGSVFSVFQIFQEMDSELLLYLGIRERALNLSGGPRSVKH